MQRTGATRGAQPHDRSGVLDLSGPGYQPHADTVPVPAGDRTELEQAQADAERRLAEQRAAIQARPMPRGLTR